MYRLDRLLPTSGEKLMPITPLEMYLLIGYVFNTSILTLPTLLCHCIIL